MRQNTPRILLYAAVVLIASLLVYARTADYDFTWLDDTIFIKDFESYNRSANAYSTSFKRGVFNETKDTYYRPLLLNSFVFDYKRSRSTEIEPYHATNIALHCISAILVLWLLLRCRISPEVSAVLALIFAVHPVLGQAVAWIPGRNDTLLAMFVLSFLITATRYIDSISVYAHSLVVVQSLFLLCAMFTKETGIIAAPVAAMLVLFVQRANWKSTKTLVLGASWILTPLVWWMFRSNATVLNQGLTIADISSNLLYRLPLVPQYLGKIFVPINLSPFPTLEDTSTTIGLVATILLVVGIIWFLYTKKSASTSQEEFSQTWRTILTGTIWFLLFLLPVMIVPRALNDQTFEHRLYVPIIGLLLLLAPILSTVKNKNYILGGGAILALIFATINIQRLDVFSDKMKFWNQAVTDSPNSAYANMMLGSRIDANVQDAKSIELIKKAHSLNPTEKYVNYYMGNMYWAKNDFTNAEKHYKEEVKENPMPELLFRLARTAFERKDTKSAQGFLERYVSLAPSDVQAQNNLLLLYLDTQQFAKARTHLNNVKALGIQLPQEIEATVQQRTAQKGL